MAFNLDDYEPVAARHSRWLADHPVGRTITDVQIKLAHQYADLIDEMLNGGKS